MLNNKIKFAKRVNPNGPNGGKVARFDNKNDVVDKGKDLNKFGGVLVRKKLLDLGEKSVDGVPKVSAKDCSSETLALKNALGDFEECKGRVRVWYV